MHRIPLTAKRDCFPIQLKSLVFVIERQCVVMNYGYSSITTMVTVMCGCSLDVRTVLAFVAMSKLCIS